jgi:hypothetical protein
MTPDSCGGADRNKQLILLVFNTSQNRTVLSGSRSGGGESPSEPSPPPPPIKL